LHAALVLSPHPRARIRSVEIEAALALPGVAAVLTGADLPGIDLLARGDVYYVGHPVAVVLAGEPEAAAAASEAVRVDYEACTPVLDPVAAMRADAPLARPDLHGGRDGAAGAHGRDAGAHGSDAGPREAGGARPRN